MPHEANPSFPVLLPPRYRFDRFLSQSEIGATLLVFDAGLRQAPAVVKFQALDAASNHQAEREFVRHCATLSGIRHPHVSAPYTYGTVRGPKAETYGYATRAFVPGLSLDEVSTPLDSTSALTVATQVCHGVDALHALGVIHYDLKPHNIVARRAHEGDIDELSQCVIIDQTYRANRSSGPAVLNDVTLQYIAPELTGGSAGAPTSDLFSIGVLLYVILSGRAPFSGGSVSRVIRAQRSREYEPLSALRPDVATGLLDIVERLMEPYPQNRPQSAQEVIALLDEVNANGQGGDQSRVAYLPPTFVGRAEELAQVREALALESPRPNPAVILVRAAPQGGATSFLREIQDQVEAQGITVLTAEPRGKCGQSLQTQLYRQVHDIVRRSQTDASLGVRRRATSVTDLLDDFFVATKDRRMVLFIDGWPLCDLGEREFLRRLVRQERAHEDGPGRNGVCHVVLGASRNPDQAADDDGNLYDTVVTLGRLTAGDLERLVRGASPSLSFSRAELGQIAEVSASRPGVAVKLIGKLAAADATERAHLLRAHVERSQSIGEDLQIRKYVTSLSANPARAAYLAISLWGDELLLDEWRDLLGECCGAGAEDLRYADVVPGSRGARLMSRHSHLRDGLLEYLDPEVVADLSNRVLRVTRSRWRTNDPELLVPLLLHLARMGAIPTRVKWAARRAVLILMSYGRYAEVSAFATAMRNASRGPALPPWVDLAAYAASLEAGTEGVAPEDEVSQPSSIWDVYRNWIRARGLRRARLHREAFEVLQNLVVRAPGVGTACRGVLEDYGTSAAYLNERASARDARRRLLECVRSWSTQSKYGLRDLVSTPSGQLAHSVVRRLARYYRVRARMNEAAGRFDAAAATSRRERALHVLDGNRCQEAACLNNEGVALLRGDRAMAAVDVFERCISIREDVDDERGLVAVLNNLALASSSVRHLGVAAAALNRARVVANRNGLIRHRNLSALNLSLAYARGGQLRDARRVLTRLIRDCERASDDDTLARSLFNYAYLALDSWHLTVAEKYSAKLRRVLKSSRAVGAGVVPEILEAEIAVRTRDAHRLEEALDSEFGKAPYAAYYRYALSTLLGTAERHAMIPMHAIGLGARLRVRAIRRSSSNGSFRTTTLRRLAAAAAGKGVQRGLLEYLDSALGGASDVPQDGIALCLATLEHPQYREGHDDLHIGIRAKLAHTLLAQGRAREAWGLVEEAIRRFRILERKVGRWQAGAKALTELYRCLQGVLCRGGRAPAVDRARFSASLRAQAFTSLLDSRGSIRVGMHGKHVLLLRDLGQVIRSDTDTRACVAAFIQTAIETTGAQRGAVVLARPNGPQVYVHLSPDSHEAPATEADLSWSVLSQVLTSGERAIFNDALASEELASHRSIAALNLRSLVCVPLPGAEGTVGVLYLDHRSIAGLFGDDDLHVLSFMASVIALLIESTELREVRTQHEAELEEAHRHLVRTEKNRLVGQIASGMVHDLKNLLTTIIARSQLLTHQINNESVVRSLKSMERAARIGGGLLEKLQECSRDHTSAKVEVVDLAALAHESIDLLGPRLSVAGQAGRSGVSVQIDATPGVTVRGVPGEFREMFLNLIVNALDAMPDGGDLSLRIARQDGIAQVSVSDSGSGISPEVTARVFEPFYTTKGGRGTGLGLAIVKSIVLRYGGSIGVQSVEGQGASFEVELPLSSPDVEDDANAQEKTPPTRTA